MSTGAPCPWGKVFSKIVMLRASLRVLVKKPLRNEPLFFLDSLGSGTTSGEVSVP